jgi:hypothetical protein
VLSAAWAVPEHTNAMSARAAAIDTGDVVIRAMTDPPQQS